MKSKIVNNFRAEMNEAGALGKPFFFMTDFEMEKPVLHFLDELPDNILLETPGYSNTDSAIVLCNKKIKIERYPVHFDTYESAFTNVIRNIRHGNTYLLNLTFPTDLDIDCGLNEIFNISKAKYKLLYRDEFVVFSPEIFVRIKKGEIRSFPMKGTIDASLPDAADIIMNDVKERAEHDTIVDLIRNDMSVYADEVRVERYRYIDTIRTPDSDLLQVSSEISGRLPEDWRSRIGDIMLSLLPAGSVSGAPKKETLRIIRESELSPRGYYTGVFGIFDGIALDSAVMIRFIEQNKGRYVYRSGGGITSLSDVRKEYQELIDKVYVPSG